MSVTEPRGEELIARYRANYGIPEDAHVTEDMILHHWELEKQLRHSLLESTPENRWEVFEEAYTRLYQELGWLNELADVGEDHTADFSVWHQIIGEPPQHIYEVGSGKGELVSYLAEQGFACKATEITRERGEKWASSTANLTWGNSDGIHLAQFEPEESYDVLISRHVVEHMHPDDVQAHCIHAFKILKPGGRYVLTTPHKASGPSDITRVFGHADPLGMHLKEYTYRELATPLRGAGFTVSAAFRFPKSLRARLPFKSFTSRVYLGYLIWLEGALASIGDHRRRLRTAKAARAALFPENIMVAAHKPH